MSYKPETSEHDGSVVRYLACRQCGRQTLLAMLSQYGARCFDCFEAYCAQVGRDGAVDKRRIRASIRAIGQPANPRAWAYALRERHQGEALSKAQIDAYMAALGNEYHTESE